MGWDCMPVTQINWHSLSEPSIMQHCCQSEPQDFCTTMQHLFLSDTWS